MKREKKIKKTEYGGGCCANEKKKHLCCGFAFGSSDLEFKSASDKIDIILG